MDCATLYGVGVGPGAPDLLTLRAVSILRQVPVILAPASPRNDFSSALEIARPLLRPDVRVVRLDFPMTRDRSLREAAWTKAAHIVRSLLEGGEDAAFPTIGDPLVYSTFGYLLQTLLAETPHIPVQIVPGITSFQAAAARTRSVLCEDDESLLVLPGINDRNRLEQSLSRVENAVIVKAYRNLPQIVQALDATDRLAFSRLCSRVEREGEIVSPLSFHGETPHYMSLILSLRHGGA